MCHNGARSYNSPFIIWLCVSVTGLKNMMLFHVPYNLKDQVLLLNFVQITSTKSQPVTPDHFTLSLLVFSLVDVKPH